MDLDKYTFPWLMCCISGVNLDYGHLAFGYTQYLILLHQAVTIFLSVAYSKYTTYVQQIKFVTVMVNYVSGVNILTKSSLECHLSLISCTDKICRFYAHESNCSELLHTKLFP